MATLACTMMLFITFGYSQKDAQSLQYIMKGDFEMVRVDAFSNIYILDQNKILKKYSPDLQLLFNYSIYGLGEITELDISNPQKIMLFFSDYQTVVFLDNTLSEINRLNLEDMGFWSITSAAMSPDNNIWIYDPAGFKVIKIDDQGDELFSSNENYFGQLTGDIKPRLSVNQSYVVCSTDSEYMIFDNFGKHLQTRKSNSEKTVLVQGNLVLQSEKKIWIEPVKPQITFDKKLLFESGTPILDFHISTDQKLYILDELGLGIVNKF